jgi:hypothetical protein
MKEGNPAQFSMRLAACPETILVFGIFYMPGTNPKIRNSLFMC